MMAHGTGCLRDKYLSTRLDHEYVKDWQIKSRAISHPDNPAVRKKNIARISLSSHIEICG